MSRLSKAPLQEVIFEVYWSLERDSSTGIEGDPQFPVALGVLKEKVKDRFPELKTRIQNWDKAPEFIYNRHAVVQFRESSDGNKLLQLGPGVFTVNDLDKHYDWEVSFKPNLTYGLEQLEAAYDEKPLYEKAVLRYIDSVKVNDYEFSDWLQFINSNFQLSLSNGLETLGAPEEVSIQQLFKLPNEDELHLYVNSNTNGTDQQLTWQTIIDRKGTFDMEQLIEWAEEAHRKSSDVFKEFCKDHFYASFN